MVLSDKETNWFDMYNTKKSQSIIIATEMLLGHKIFNDTNKTVIAIPNNIDKELILSIVNRMNVSKVFLYADEFSLLHTSSAIYINVIQALEEQNIKVDFRVALTETSISSDNETVENGKVA